MSIWMAAVVVGWFALAGLAYGVIAWTVDQVMRDED